MSPARMAVAAILTADIAETQALSKEIDGVVGGSPALDDTMVQVRPLS